MTEHDAAVEVIETLKMLRDKKARMYGPLTWKKHGELVSMFANVARKTDRLEILVDKGSGHDSSQGDTFVDTVADLCAYTLLYSGWLSGEQFLGELYGTTHRIRWEHERGAKCQMNNSLIKVMVAERLLENSVALGLVKMTEEEKLAHLRSIAANCVKWLSLAASTESEEYQRWRRSILEL